MKKTIGLILMIVGAIGFLLLMMGEVSLARSGDLPNSFLGWIGNLILPALAVAVFFIGRQLKK